MTEKEIRSKVVEIAKGWLGCKESDGSHKKIIRNLSIYFNYTYISYYKCRNGNNVRVGYDVTIFLSLSNSIYYSSGTNFDSIFS